jgi:solute carrier family 13 (sodium-dependent dicarboxylate transporter), member 2/3/5
MNDIDVQSQTAPDGMEAGSDALRRRLGIVLAPGLFILILLLPFPQLTVEAHRLAAIMALVIVLWVTEVVPLPVAALLGPVLAVVLGVARVGPAFAQMANPLIFLFIGSFILAEGLFAHRVNERIAYGVLSLKFVGARPIRILLAYAGIAAFLSAWMSNTATAAMLLPIGMSLLAFMESHSEIPKSYGKALLLAMAYATGRGGMATPVGTPPNLIAVGMIDSLVGVRITFVEWMMFAVPISLVLLVTLFVYLTWVGGVKVKEIPGAEQIIYERRRALGPWRRGEINALAAFGVTICLWVVPGLLPLFLGSDHALTQQVLAVMPEAVAALIGAVLLFILPVSKTERSTLTWKQASNIDWGTLLLFGGGLSLGSMALSTGLAESVGSGITGLIATDSLVSLTFAATLFTVLLTELMSNTAAANIAIPIVIAIALAAGVDPIPPAIAAAMGASIAALMPVSTPPNAIVYASGRVSIMDMVKYGLLMDLLAVIVVPPMVLWLVPGH